MSHTPPVHYATNIKTIFTELEAVVGPRVAKYVKKKKLNFNSEIG